MINKAVRRETKRQHARIRLINDISKSIFLSVFEFRIPKLMSEFYSDI